MKLSLKLTKNIRAALPDYLIWLLIAALYSPILFQLYRLRWKIIDYTHAYFILPVSLWLVWLKRKELKTAVSSIIPHPLSLILFILGLLMFIFGWKQDYLFISTLSLIPLLFGITGYLYSPGVAKALSFPILYLLLMVPPPLGVLDSITLPMRHWVSVLTEIILKAFHYPITRDGLLLSIGGHDIYMGAPCSGFRSLITMIALGLAYTYIIKGSFKKKAILLSSVIPLALLGNLLRVIGVCLATFHGGEAFGTKFHDTSGYAIFLILIFGLIGLDSLLDKFVT